MTRRGRPKAIKVPDVFATPEQYQVYGPGRGCRLALERLQPRILKTAAKHARDDSQAEEDLAQEAWIGVWEVDPSRYHAADQDYFDRAVMRTMLTASRTERRWSRGRVQLPDEDEDEEIPED